MDSKKITILSRVILILLLFFIWGNSCADAAQSTAASDHFTNPFMAFLESLTGTAADRHIIDHLVRKTAHFTQFAVLGIFTRLSFPKKGIGLLLFGAAVAGVDETLQAFSPGRSPQFSDVCLDFAGFACGLLCMMAVVSYLLKKKETVRSD